jgi:hypothetical protein
MSEGQNSNFDRHIDERKSEGAVIELEENNLRA